VRDKEAIMISSHGCEFREEESVCTLWAPGARSVELVERESGGEEKTFPLEEGARGVWTLKPAPLRPGARYGFKVDGKGPFPDPASRFQPEGVHGLSEAVDTRAFAWKHGFPALPEPARRSIYELHVGTFSPEGTFEGARRRLRALRELGIRLIEIMPVADFPGDRNWGYDGVTLFAPARSYGTPEQLAALVDEAHGLGMGVILDVVYNHFGPDGNYLNEYNPDFFDASQQTPWGAAMNFSAHGSEGVRNFFLANALYWLRDFRFDGLRLDATHAYCDAPERPFTAELRRLLEAELPDRAILLYAEDERHPARFCHSLQEGGSGLDGIWADDWHHHVRRRAAGDREGYFARYDGSLRSLASVMENGWEKQEQAPLGSPAPPLPYDRFIYCLQNHDQIGNRAFGERLHHQISPALYRALSALLLAAPETPLLFMGQEWAAKAPFLYFTHHNEELGKKITEGRRREFAGFSPFSDPENRASIPDPQSAESFRRSVLDWEERSEEPHAGVLRLYGALLRLRATEPALGAVRPQDFRVMPVEPDGLVLRRRSGDAEILVAAWLGNGAGRLPLPAEIAGWRRILTSESEGFTPDAPRPVRESAEGGFLALDFERAGFWIAGKG
jgi:maltooligosyltrehalose trehalohydrolase